MVLSALIPLLVLGAVGFALYVAASRRRAAGGGQQLPGAAPPPGDLRSEAWRVFRLVLLFVMLALAMEGVAGLIGAALPRPPGAESPRSQEVAQALSFCIVGLPALAGLARWTRARLRADPEEARSVVWAGYIGGTLLVALMITVANAEQTLLWITRQEPLDGGAVGHLLAWGAVLVVHWRLNRRRPLVDVFGSPQPRTPWYLVLGSLLGLILAGIGMHGLLQSGLRVLYDHLVLTLYRPEPAGSVVRSAVNAGVGVAVWAWFWLGHTRRAPRTERWYGAVLLGGVLGGLVATIVASGTLLYQVLVWLFGEPGPVSAELHFQSAPGKVAALVVGAAVWIHYRRALATAVRHRNEVDRVYTYLVAIVSLTVVAAAVTMVVAALVDAVTNTGPWDRSDNNAILLAVTFLVIGGPLWGMFWRRAQVNAARDDAELRSPSRRLHLIAAVGIGAGVALVALVVLLNGVLRDVTAGTVNRGTWRRTDVPLGLVLSSVAVAAYHGVVYRRDRRAMPEPVAPPSPVAPAPPALVTHDVVLVSDLTPTDADELARRLGGRVLRFTTLDEPGPLPEPDELARVVGTVARLGAHRALVTVRRGHIEVEGLHD